MRPVTCVRGRAAVLDRPDVDTDQIVPKQFLKRIERSGFGQFLFHDWRRDPGFELNRPEAHGARILLTGRNFGCGSSREHAAWALQDAGFEAVVAPSFGDIFRQNALKIGLLPVELPAEAVRGLMQQASAGELVVDLERRLVAAPDGSSHSFAIDPFRRECLLRGLDDVDLTLERGADIEAYEAAHPARVQTTAIAAP